MGQKMCISSNDTPWVTFSCNFVRINRSNNIELDFTDTVDQLENVNEKVDGKLCCCFSWLKGRETKMAKPQKEKQKKEKLRFEVIQ
jgi:hypothetical protein